MTGVAEEANNKRTRERENGDDLPSRSSFRTRYGVNSTTVRLNYSSSSANFEPRICVCYVVRPVGFYVCIGEYGMAGTVLGMKRV